MTLHEGRTSVGWLAGLASQCHFVPLITSVISFISLPAIVLLSLGALRSGRLLQALCTGCRTCWFGTLIDCRTVWLISLTENITKMTVIAAEEEKEGGQVL